MKFFVCCMVLAMVAMVSHAQPVNKKVADAGLQPAVLVNYKNPKNILLAPGTNQLSFSLDGGRSWNETRVQSPYGAFGDAVLVSGPKGTVYYFHLPDANAKGKVLDRIICQASEDGGKHWNLGAAIGNNPPKEQLHLRAVAHPAKSGVCLTWTQFDKYKQNDTTCQTNVLFAYSSNGEKWDKPVQLNQLSGDCLDGDNSVSGAIPVMDDTKKIFVAWSTKKGLFLDRSFDEGKNWLVNDLPILKQLATQMIIPGIGSLPRVPILAIDNSDSFFKNSLYVAWADQRNGPKDTDIWFLRSTNRGDYWTASPLRVNKDAPGKHQFMPWMVVDPKTGVIYLAYYDRRNYDDNQTDVYLAFSTDGGDKFQEKKISDTPFIPVEDKPFGDYLSLSADQGMIAVAWVRMDEGKTSVVVSLTRQEEIIKPEEMPVLRNMKKRSPPPSRVK
jgi:hypothetical protein